MIIDGRAIAKQIEDETKARTGKLVETRGRRPRLAIVCFGNSDSEQYAKNIEKKCEEIGIETKIEMFPETATETEVINHLKVLNADKGTDGIIVHRPMPVPDGNIIAAIDPCKDAYGYFSPSRSAVANAVVEMLQRSGAQIEGKHVVVVGRSRYNGLLIARLLLSKGATVTICHTKTFDLSWHTSQADIVVTAAGKPGLINGEMIKEGSIVVDVGMTKIDGEWTGDADFWSVNEKAAAVTPVPGGVGSVATAIILRNATDLLANKR